VLSIEDQLLAYDLRHQAWVEIFCYWLIIRTVLCNINNNNINNKLIYYFVFNEYGLYLFWCYCINGIARLDVHHRLQSIINCKWDVIGMITYCNFCTVNKIANFQLWTFIETIYLFGGWDGNHDIGDLWSYHMPSQQWTCLSKNVEDEVSYFLFQFNCFVRFNT